jgi:queuosine precursor transporter
VFVVQTSGVQRFSPAFVALAGLFVTCLIVANIIAVKFLALPFGLAVPAGVVIFPLSYLFGDVLTEVYGYAAVRRVIWLGFFCNLVAVLAIAAAIALPSAGFGADQGQFGAILGFTPFLLVASFSAYLVGEFLNSFVLAKLKIATKGRWLWTRTIGSTFVGEGADTLVFITLAFVLLPALFRDGQPLPADAWLRIVLSQWAFKVLYEVVATPLTYAVVGFLKRYEGLDAYDIKTNFSPIVLGRAAKAAVRS